MRTRPKGFTLAEMLVVMGIIVLFTAVAVPTVRSLMGSTSTAMARNSISALLARAREEAVAVQDVRGIMFVLDAHTNRVLAVMVQSSVIQDPTLPTIVLLDVMPGRDSVALPSGVRVQTVFNGMIPANSQSSTSPTDDRYMGFNPLVGGNSPGLVSTVGGVILFDGNGKLISRAYGFQLNQVNPLYGQTGQLQWAASNLCTMCNYAWTSTPVNYNHYSAQYGSVASIPGWGSGTTIITNTVPVTSQVGLILFDYDAFKSQGFTDQDADLNGYTYTTAWTVGSPGDGVHSEANEETWLDGNSTPLMISRFDGTLIRAE